MDGFDKWIQEASHAEAKSVRDFLKASLESELSAHVAAIRSVRTADDAARILVSGGRMTVLKDFIDEIEEHYERLLTPNETKGERE